MFKIKIQCAHMNQRRAEVAEEQSSLQGVIEFLADMRSVHMCVYASKCAI